MALRLNKTSKIVFAISIVILSGALGFLLWRVNQKETVAPGESKAGEVQCVCPVAGDPKSNDCICVYALGNCPGFNLPLCNETYNCYEGSDCNDQVNCSWPSVAFCNLGKCECKSGNNGCTNDNHCEPSCDGELYDPPCKSGEEVSCDGECAGCNNGYTYNACCGKEEVAPACGDGKKDSGEACDPKASPTGCSSGSTCLNNCTCSAVTNCGNGKLNTGEQCESGNPTGTTCTWDDCNQTNCTCRELTITKAAVKNCIDTDTADPKAEITYTITMKNADTKDNRTITKVKDVLDAKILTAGIVPTGIASPGAYADGKIVWKYDTNNLIIKPGETKTLTYKVTIDKNHFGEYKNTVTMTRSSGVTSDATAKILADCSSVTPLATCGNGVLDTGESCELGNPTGGSCVWDSCNKSLCTCVTTPTIPQTGIFDSTLGRILAGVTLLIIGSIVYNIPNRVLIVKRKDRINQYRVRFEKKIANR